MHSGVADGATTISDITGLPHHLGGQTTNGQSREPDSVKDSAAGPQSGTVIVVRSVNVPVTAPLEDTEMTKENVVGLGTSKQ